MEDQELLEWIITPEELKKAMQEPQESRKFKLVDVREPEEHAEEKIEGSYLVPLGEIQSRAEKELNKSEEIILYCAHGVRSLQALMALRLLGFENLRSLEGGIVAWKEMTEQTRS